MVKSLLQIRIIASLNNLKRRVRKKNEVITCSIKKGRKGKKQGREEEEISRISEEEKGLGI